MLSTDDPLGDGLDELDHHVARKWLADLHAFVLEAQAAILDRRQSLLVVGHVVNILQP